MSWSAVHTTEVKQFLKCRLAWFWSAPQPRGLGLEPDRPAPALHLGSLVHAALEEHYDRGTPPAAALVALALEDREKRQKRGDLWPEQIEALMESAALGAGMLQGYEKWAVTPAAAQFKVIATETAWELPLFRKIKIAGRFDMLVEKDDGLWVLDFKTTTRTETSWTQQDLQASVYVWAARRLYGPEVRGIIFRFLRKSLPHTYDKLVLKSGKLTKKKALINVTTYDEYLRALAVVALEDVTALSVDEAKEAVYGVHEHRNSALECEEFQVAFVALKKEYWGTTGLLRATVNPYFWDVEEYRTDEQLRRYMKYVVIPAAREMKSKRKGRWIGPTGLGASFSNCGWCAFKTPCQAWAEGADYKDILRTEYRLQERYETVKQ